MTEVAKVFEVSRMTLHNWFRGAPIRDKNTQKIKAFLVALNQVWTDQFENHKEELPLSHQKQAKEFLETRIVSKLTSQNSIVNKGNIMNDFKVYAVKESQLITIKAESESEAKAILEHRIKENKIKFSTTQIRFK